MSESRFRVTVGAAEVAGVLHLPEDGRGRWPCVVACHGMGASKDSDKYLLLGRELARELDVRDWGTPEARRHALLTTVQAFIQQHLGDPGLSPAMIAAAHHKARFDFPGDREKPAMRPHPMIRTNTATGDVPCPQ